MLATTASNGPAELQKNKDTLPENHAFLTVCNAQAVRHFATTIAVSKHGMAHHARESAGQCLLQLKKFHEVRAGIPFPDPCRLRLPSQLQQPLALNHGVGHHRKNGIVCYPCCCSSAQLNACFSHSSAASSRSCTRTIQHMHPSASWIMWLGREKKRWNCLWCRMFSNSAIVNCTRTIQRMHLHVPHLVVYVGQHNECQSIVKFDIVDHVAWHRKKKVKLPRRSSRQTR